jgi:general secretion pathway protein G
MSSRNSNTRKKPRARGFSLLEILVVLSIMALLAGVVAIGVMRHLESSRITTTKLSARNLRSAAMTHRMDHADECPSFDTLVQAGALDETKGKDAWDSPFTVACDEKGSIRVTSPGPDKKLGTPDDLTIPDTSK